MKKISVAQPLLNGREKEYVIDCLDSSWISSNGKYISAFEKAFAEFCGVKHAISTNNGTTALHLAMVGMDLQPGDEVIVPTVTYIATANAVRYCGATPVFSDVVPGILNIDPVDIESKITPRVKGIVAVHLYGHPADMLEINRIAKKHGLWVIEDAAEAHGAKVFEKRVGSFGDCATFSFFGNKIITTGEGGMITTNNDELAEKLRLFRGQGMDPKRRYWFPVIGYNYRMTNIQAAIGLAQMETIEKSLAARKSLANRYKTLLSSLSHDIETPFTEPWATHVNWMYNIFIRNCDETRRDRIMKYMDDRGVETRPVFYPMHKLPPYERKSIFPIADSWANRGINLPTHELLDERDLIYITQTLAAALSS